jgi:hypothetical protein
MNLVRLAARLLALPGRLLIRWLNDRKRSNGVPPLGTFLRGCVHAFLWFWVMIITVAVLNPVPATPVAAPPASTTRPSTVPTTRWTPPPTTTPVPTPTTTPPVEDADESYVPLPDDDDDDGRESRFCRKRWYC